MHSNYIILAILFINSINSFYSEKIEINKNQTDLFKLNHTQNENENFLIAKKEDHAVIVPPQPKHLNRIKNKLHEEMVKKCDYGHDPLLKEICPNFKEENHLNSNNFDNFTLSNIEHLIVDYNMVKKLKEGCATGEWCLDESVIKEKNTQEQKKKSSLNLEALRLFSSCYSNIADYIDRCVNSEISKSVLSMGKAFYQFNPNINPNQYCPEHTLRLIHVYVASMINHKPNNLPEFNTCEDNIYGKKCSNECKKIAKGLNKLETCCSNIEILKNFKAVKWYFLNKNEVNEYCEMPLTSICWSDGKYYLGISPNVLVIAVVLSVTLTSTFLMLVYLICCRKRCDIDQPYYDTYEYSKLKEDEMEAIQMDDSIQMQKRNKGYNEEDEFDLNNNENISRFINQNQTDIKSLLT